MGEHEASRRRSILVDAARRLLSEAGVEGTRIDDLRESVGMSIGSVYHHFPSKAHLVAAVFLEVLTDYQRAFLAELSNHVEAEAGIRAMVGFHLRWCTEREESARLLFGLEAPRPSEPGGDELQAKNRRFFSQVISWWRPHVHYRALQPMKVEEAYVIWLGPAQELCRLWLSGRLDSSPTESAEQLATAAWNALRAADPPHDSDRSSGPVDLPATPRWEVSVEPGEGSLDRSSGSVASESVT